MQLHRFLSTRSTVASCGKKDNLSATMSKERICGDVLVIPSAQDGHVNPMMAIAVQLMAQGISVTVLLENHHELLDNFRSEELESKGLLHVPVLTRGEDEEDLEADAGRGKGHGHSGGRRKDERNEEGQEGHDEDAGRGEGRMGRGRGRGRGRMERNEEDQEGHVEDVGRREGRMGRGRGRGQSGGMGKDEDVNEKDRDADAGKGGGGRGKGRGRGGKSGVDTFLEKVLAEQEAGGQGPKCLMGDQVKPNLQTWANRLKIPRYVQMSSPATLAYFTYKFRSLLDDGMLEQLVNGKEDPVINLPGLPLLQLSDMPFQATRNATDFAANGETYGEAGGFLFNTFYDLEASAIDAFHAQLKSGALPGQQVPKLLSLGPLLPDKFFSEETFTGKSKDSECIEWLNSRPPLSVLYIAFGTRNCLNQDQAQELAYALDASKQSFLWVLRAQPAKGQGTDDFNEMEEVTKLLPPGFEERTKDRGLIYPKFAPQLEILSNPATGGFLSHSGWNSVLESISRGVPTIAWPMGAEQSLCTRILVDQAEMSVEVKKGIVTNHHEVVDRGLIEHAIRRLMMDPAGKEMRKKAQILQQQARAAMSPQGSSRKNMATLVEDIKNWQPKSLQTQ